MDSAAIKLELMQQPMSIADDKTLRKVANFFKKEVVINEEEGDISDEEYAEFEEMRAKRLSGEVKFLTEQESVAEARRLIAAERR
jgi:hypothetical protein